MGFIRHIRDVIRFMQLPKEQRRLTFYSEGKNYWPHLEGLIVDHLNNSDIPICYVSSDVEDPGLNIKNSNYHTFVIDEGFVRNWFFQSIETEVMVMTMPDLHQYQVKRSVNDVHYIYIQHSLVSLHMIYRKGAFDYYNTIFCAGPHHVNEIRAMEEKYNTPAKNIVEHGYGRLDSILNENKKYTKKENFNRVVRNVLFAPTWGLNGCIESGIGEKIVDLLIENEFLVTLRPHPQTIKFAKDNVNSILQKHINNPLFTYENNVSGQDSLHESDVMISDWSGAALEYAFGLGKPVVFINTTEKVNNINYKELNIEPFEVSIRTSIGHVIDISNISNITKVLRTLKSANINNNFIYNIGESGMKGREKIIEILQKKSC